MSAPHMGRTITFDDETGILTEGVTVGYRAIYDYDEEYNAHMTALEYMEKQLAKNKRNYEREQKRGVPDKMLHDIELKISYYAEAVEALKK